MLIVTMMMIDLKIRKCRKEIQLKKKNKSERKKKTNQIINEL